MQFWYNLGADYVHEDKTIWVKKNTFLVRGNVDSHVAGWLM